MTDSFMLELFLGELRAQGAKLSAALSAGYNGADVLLAAAALKSGARMLGLSKFADLCSKLEKYFSHADSASPAAPAVAEAVSFIADFAKSDAASIEADIVRADARLDEILKSDFPEPAVKAEKGKPAPSPADSPKIYPKIDSAMKPLFLQETDARLAALNAGLVELEQDFLNFSKIEALMRASHSLKGAARVVGLDPIVRLTHQMENCFVAAQNKKVSLTSEAVDVFLECADFISNLCKTQFAEIDLTEVDSLLAKLAAVEKNKAIPSAEARTPVKVVESSSSGGDSTVKISAKNLNSMMELAAESLIENRRVESFRESLTSIKAAQEQIVRQLEEVMGSVEGSSGSEFALARFEQLRRALHACIASTRAEIDSISEYSRRNIMLSGKLYSEVLSGRMRPFSDGLQGFPRMVRDIAHKAGKRIILEIAGGDVPVDRDVLEKLDAPMTHILRNACDHGIEPPQERAAAGKDQSGKVRIRAWHSAGLLMLKISDDGRGLDEETIRRKILEKKLASPELLQKMSRDEIFEFLFLPGFTTKDKITELSGRGFGLDIVLTMLREVGGTISVASEAGRGASFIMKLPITRSVLKALNVRVDGQPYAFPLGRVHRILKFSHVEASPNSGGRSIDFGGKRAELVDTSRVLGLGDGKYSEDELHLVLISDRGRLFAFEVQSLPTESELVVRPLDRNLGKIPCVAAASLNEDGEPVLIFDVDDLAVYAERSDSVADVARRRSRGVRAAEEPLKRILIVDDSATVRETQRKILEAAGYAVDMAVDGMDGWNMVRLGDYDLIVSDVDMPRMGGFELVKKIRARNPEIPIVIVSYKDRGEDRNKGLAAGADYYLTKSSFQDDTFIRCVRELIN